MIKNMDMRWRKAWIASCNHNSGTEKGIFSHFSWKISHCILKVKKIKLSFPDYLKKKLLVEE